MTMDDYKQVALIDNLSLTSLFTSGTTESWNTVSSVIYITSYPLAVPFITNFIFKISSLLNIFLNFSQNTSSRS